MKINASAPKRDERGNVLKDKDGSQLKMQTTVDYPIGETLEQNRKSHGDEIVNRLFVAKAKIEIQDAVRRMLKAGKPQKEIQDVISKYVLGQKQVSKKSAKDRAKEQYAKMTEAEKAEFLKDLRAS